MSDKPNPVDDLKEGLRLLLRAAKGAVEQLPTGKLEDVAKDAAKEVGRAVETVADELDKAWKSTVGGASQQRPPQAPPGAAPPPVSPPPAENAAPPQEPPHDDAYAPEPPHEPRTRV